jgi:hypothetical protein
LRKLLLQSELFENHFYEAPELKVFANLFKGGFTESFLKTFAKSFSKYR